MNVFIAKLDFVVDVADFGTINVSYFPITVNDNAVARPQIAPCLDFVNGSAQLPTFNSQGVADVSCRVSALSQITLGITVSRSIPLPPTILGHLRPE